MPTEAPIRILIDGYRVEDSADLWVDDSDGYWRARAALQDAIRHGKPLKVAVRNRSMESFFGDLAEEKGVAIRHLDPRTKLLEALNVSSLPPQLMEDPQAVVDLRLLSVAAQQPRHAGEDASDWVLRVTLGPIWACPVVEKDEELAAIVLDCVQAVRKANHPLLVSLRNQRLQAWAEASPDFHDFLAWLVTAPAERSRALAVGQLLQRYPWHEASQWLAEENLVIELNALPDAREWLKRVCLRLSAPEADPILPPGVAVRVDLFVRRVMAEHGLMAALRTVGGALSCELNIIRQAVGDRVRKGEPLLPEEIEEIKYRFSDRPEAKSLVALVDELSPRPRPEPIQRESSWENVSSWLVEQYLPFYRRACLLGQLETTEFLVEAFEEWILANYAELSRRNDCLAHTLLQTIAEATASGPVLVVLVDGFGAQRATAMEESLTSHGLYVDLPLQVRLAIAPTLTQMSKTAMLRGQLPCQFRPNGVGAEGYRQLILNALHLRDGDVSVSTDREGSLEELAEAPGRVLLYLANRFDEDLIHSSLPAIVRRERINAYLDELGRSIAEAAVALQRRARTAITVIVIGDHGATELSRREGCSIVLPNGVETSHGRVVLGGLDRLPDGTALLDPATFLLQGKVLIARGYRYFGQRPLGLTHGGITPQEMAVAMVLASTAPPEGVQPPVVTVSGIVRRGRRDNPVQVFILNPNPKPIRISQVRIRLIRWATGVPRTVGSREQQISDASLDASEVRSDRLSLDGIVEWSAGGQPRTQEISQVVATTGAALRDDEFEEMFEER
jgi:hypothetical protein